MRWWTQRRSAEHDSKKMKFPKFIITHLHNLLYQQKNGGEKRDSDSRMEQMEFLSKAERKTFGNDALPGMPAGAPTSISISYSWGIACSYDEWLMCIWTAFNKSFGSQWRQMIETKVEENCHWHHSQKIYLLSCIKACAL